MSQYIEYSEGEYSYVTDPVTHVQCRSGQQNHKFVEEMKLEGAWVLVGGYEDISGVSFDDYYLPSSGDMQAMRAQLYLYDLGGFSADIYWTSSEESPYHAWYLNFSDGNYSNQYKYITYRVRACRSFTTTDIYALRDLGPAGGYIFRIVNNGGGSYTYFEAAPSDQSAEKAWSNIVDAEVTGTNTDAGEGQANTVAIMAQVEHTDSAAKLCNNLIVAIDSDCKFREGVRDFDYVVDMELEEGGFSGDEDDTWRNIGRTTGIPIPSDFNDVNFYAVNRVGLTMPDTIGSNDVDILTPTFQTYYGATGTPGSHDRLFDGNSHTIYFKMRQTATVTTSTQWLFKMGNAADTAKGIVFWTVAGYLIFDAGDGAHNAEVAMIDGCDANLMPAEWVDVLIVENRVTDRLTVNLYKNSDDSALGTAVNHNIAAWTFNTNNNAEGIGFESLKFAFADFKKFTGIKTLAQCRNSAYVTDIQFYYPTIWDGTDVSTGANHLTRNVLGYSQINKIYSTISTYLLDYGYSLYRSGNKAAGAGYEDIYVPNTVAGVSVARTINDSDGNPRVKIEDHEGSLTSHNLADSLINIPATSWDRSSTTIFENAVRAGYYDASNPNRWHPSELDYLIFSQNCKSGYQGKNFFKITDSSIDYKSTARKFLTELFSFDNNKTTTHLLKILTYTGDQIVLDSAVKLYADASVNATIVIGLGGKAGTTPIKIYHGDATVMQLTAANMDDVIANYINKTYSGTSIYTIYIFNPENLSGFSYVGVGTMEVYPTGGDIAEFSKCTNLKTLRFFYNSVQALIGTINGLTTLLEDLELGGNNTNGIDQDIRVTVSGNIARFTNLEILYIFGKNTISGDATVCTKLTNVYVSGDNTIDGSISGWTDLISLEGQGQNTLHGNGSALTGFKFVCLAGKNYITLVITNMTQLEYLSVGGTGAYSVSGSINLLTELYYLGVAGNITGDIANCTKLRYFYGVSTITKPTRVILNTKLCAFYSAGAWVWTSAQINQLLADFLANKDNTNASDTARTIELLGADGTEAPTGQGLTDKAALEAYHSPTPPGTNAVWTVTTRT